LRRAVFWPKQQPDSGNPHDHDTASKPDSDGRADRRVQRGRDGYGTVELPVEEERHSNRWGDLFELHDAGHDEF
jgi:hypothetical protein